MKGIFLIIFLFCFSTSALEIIQESKTFIIFKDFVSGEKTFSLKLSFKPEYLCQSLHHRQEAFLYLTEPLPQRTITYAQVAQHQADWVEHTYAKEKNRLRIKMLLNKAKDNIKQYRKIYSELIGDIKAGKVYQAKQKRATLLKLEKNPEIRPNPLVVAVLEKRLEELKKKKK